MVIETISIVYITKENNKRKQRVHTKSNGNPGIETSSNKKNQGIDNRSIMSLAESM